MVNEKSRVETQLWHFIFLQFKPYCVNVIKKPVIRQAEFSAHAQN
jgi:hypothetical protein